jgi:hypothetical protein
VSSRTVIAVLAVLALAGLFVKAVVDKPRVAGMVEELSREVRGVPAPHGSSLGACEQNSGLGKGAYVACSFVGTIGSQTLEQHYDTEFIKRGWRVCENGRSDDGLRAWRVYCKGDRRATLSRLAGDSTKDFGLTLTWPR